MKIFNIGSESFPLIICQFLTVKEKIRLSLTYFLFWILCRQYEVAMSSLPSLKSQDINLGIISQRGSYSLLIFYFKVN